MKNLFLIAAALILLCGGCKKDHTDHTYQTTLPAATQTGAGTFGAMVNGVILVPLQYDFTMGTPLYVSYTPYSPFSSTVLNLGASDTANKPGRLIIIHSNFKLQEGTTYQLQEGATNIVSATFTLGAGNSFLVKAPLTGQLVITKLDMNSGIISGTFSFDAVNNSNDKVEVRDGRFDLHF